MPTTTTTAKTAPKQMSLTTPHDRDVRVERVFAAPRDRVWKAFTDPKLLAQWWGRGNTLLVERLELTRGGHWRFVEQSEEGVSGFEGRFREVAPEEMLMQTFEWDGMPGYTALETITFEDVGEGRTRVVTTLLCYTTEERDGMVQSGMEAGMAQSYAALDRVLASA
jgi:uncharacterized protein YndB with AHSA1/START domain